MYHRVHAVDVDNILEHIVTSLMGGGAGVSDPKFEQLLVEVLLILKLTDLLSTASRQRPLSCWKRAVQAHFHSIMNPGVIMYQQPLLWGPLNSHHCICPMQLIGFPWLGNIITICAYLSVKPLLLNSDLESPGCSGGGGVIGWCCRDAETWNQNWWRKYCLSCSVNNLQFPKPLSDRRSCFTCWVDSGREPGFLFLKDSDWFNLSCHCVCTCTEGVFSTSQIS